MPLTACNQNECIQLQWKRIDLEAWKQQQEYHFIILLQSRALTNRERMVPKWLIYLFDNSTTVYFSLEQKHTHTQKEAQIDRNQRPIKILKERKIRSWGAKQFISLEMKHAFKCDLLKICNGYSWFSASQMKRYLIRY